MIKALIFDVSGVLTFVHFKDVYEGFAKKVGLPANFVTNYFEDKGHLDKQLIGEENFHDIFVSMSELVPNSSENEFRELWVRTIAETTTINSELLHWVDEWRKTYTCGILTNNTEGRGMFDESIGLHQHFDFVLESHKERMKKPNPEFFMLALQKANCAPGEAIYVDDQQRHADAATSVGMHGIVFTDNNLFKQQVEEILTKQA